MKLQALHKLPAEESQLIGSHTAFPDVLRIERVTLSDQNGRRLKAQRIRGRGELRQVVLAVRFVDNIDHNQMISADLAKATKKSPASRGAYAHR
jgi:hypothetical protein